MPTDELDEKTESLNQSGVFLQMHVANQLEPEWETLFEHPVRISSFLDPLSNHLPAYSIRDIDCFAPSIFVDAMRQSMDKKTAKETSIDIAAWKDIRHIGHFHLCIESKKLHPDYVDWVFFPKFVQEDFRCLIREKLRDSDKPIAELLKTFNIDGQPDTVLGIRSISKDYFDHPVCDFGISLKQRHVEAEYYKSDKTKVDQAARQIIEGTYGFVMNKIIHDILSGEPVLSKGITDFFIPIIVTNANLFICKFDKKNIDPKTGKITKDPNYVKVDSLIYEYPVPKTIQFPEPLEESISSTQNAAIIKWHVLVFSAKGFSKFLDAIKSTDRPVL